MEKLKLINGRFGAVEAADVLAAMVKVKTDFHHQKINKNTALNEEDIKRSEERIKKLNQELSDVLKKLAEAESKGKKIDIEAEIHWKVV